MGRIRAKVGEQRFLDGLQAELRSGVYQPSPSRRVLIPKAGKPGQFRPLGVPTVKDRVVQGAVKLLLEPIFEAQFWNVSYGFRPGRSTHGALEHIRLANDDKLTDITDYWSKAEDHLLREYGISHKLTAPASFIVHSLNDVNQQLRLGRYFFADIVRDGIVLYEAPGHTFAQPETLAPAEALKEAQGYFDEWFPTATEFLAGAAFHAQRGSGKIAAFNLHQATERLYHCVLLVLTLYSPLCRARHRGLYAERHTMPMSIDFGHLVRCLDGFCSA